jgi:hypothetical protein
MKMLSAAALGCFVLIGATPVIAEELCVGPACIEHHRDRDQDIRVERREREHCKDITVREDGETRHIRKCSEERLWR